MKRPVTLRGRRSLLRATTALMGAVLLAGGLVACEATPSQLATDVQLISAGISSFAGSLGKQVGISDGLVAKVTKYAKQVSDDAAAVSAATSGLTNATDTTGLVKEIASCVQAIADVALPQIKGLANASLYVSLIDAAVSLLPTILAAVGLTAAPSAAAIYAPTEARLILARKL